MVPDDGPLPTHTLPSGMKLTLLSPTSERMTAMKAEWEAQLDDDEDPLTPGDWEAALERFADEARLQPDALGAADWTEEWDASDFDTYATEPLDEDTKAPNGSSIAFVLEYGDARVLLTGDAFPSVLAAGLERYRTERQLSGPIPFDAIKLSHHGSKNNVSEELLALVACDHWLVSTNGSRHHHPSPETIARVIEASAAPHLYFNYVSDETEVWDDEDLADERSYEATFGSDGQLVVPIVPIVEAS